MEKISATFSKRGQNFTWNFALSSSILVGGGSVILLLLYAQPILALVVALIAISIAAVAMRQIRKRLIIIEFDGETLSILERNHRITLVMPFAYKIGIRHTITNNSHHSHAYLQLSVYDEGEGLVFEERIPAEQEMPHLPIMVAKIAYPCYRNLKPFPDVLWSIIQTLGIPTNPEANSLIPIPVNDPQLLALYETGKEHLLKYNFESAIQIFSQIITRYPDHPIAYYNRGIVQLNQSTRLNDALEDFTKAITLDHSFISAYMHRAKTYSLLKQWEHTLSDSKIALASTPDAELFNQCGVAYHALNQLDEALESYTQAIMLDPSYAPAYFNRGLLFQRTANTISANADFERAKTLDITIQLG